MLDRALIFLDLETTGATAHSDRITEIGLVEVDRGRHIGEWSSLVNPGRPIPPLIESLTGITDAMVAGAPTFAELARDLHERLAGKTLVAHNARFDFGFLRSEFRRVGLKYDPDVLCTVRLSRRLYPQERRHNLDSIIERYGLACDNRHRALADARVLWDFTQRIHRDIETSEIRNAVADQLKKPRLPPGLPADLPERIPEAPGVYAFYSQGNVALHVGKSANLRARVLSHFSADKRPAWRACAEITRVEWDAAAGELGMQIRHMQWLKHLQPLHNSTPRHDGELWALQWDPVDGPSIPLPVDTVGLDLSRMSRLYGMFRSRRTALNALRKMADEHGLCHIGTGLQTGPGPCLGYRLKRCHGLCVGRQSTVAHSMRMMQALHALRLRDWPHPGPIGIREHDPMTGRTEIHVLDRWRHLGTADADTDPHDILQTRRDAPFEAGIYRILLQYFKSIPRDAEIVALG
ncbi:MAG TPA: exonuclease domain-containing protein [Burkholderiales bacterium]|nr:exonuclease domain-containing protein [Burkholderiales bacterium]